MITVVKQNHRGEPLLSYTGQVVERGATWVCLVAPFNHDDKDAGYVVFRRGDTFVEWHYSDRWYNVFELHNVDNGRLKGWYCNVTRPAVIGQDEIHADDLALDVFISPAREMLVLDEDEFAALDLPEADRLAAQAAVETIRLAVEAHEAPFM